MPAPYMNEVSKVMESPHIMQYIKGHVADVGCGPQKITPDAIGYDGRDLGAADKVQDGLYIDNDDIGLFDTVFSSHFLEHVSNPHDYVMNWYQSLRAGGHLVLYLPEATAYNNYKNPEHMFNWRYEDFLFWFRRSFCGDGKNYKGEVVTKRFEIVHQGLDILGLERYSFFIVAQKV